MTTDIVELIKGFLFAPVETFHKVKDADIGEALKYFIIILLINVILTAIVTLIVASAVITVIEKAFSGLGIALPLAAGVGVILWAIIMVVLTLFLVFIVGAWLHLWVYLLGGKKGYMQTMKAIMYGSTPYMLIGWIPIIGGFIGGLWSLVVEILGIRELHGISTGRVIAAYLIAVIIPIIVIILVALLGFFVITNMGSVGPI